MVPSTTLSSGAEPGAPAPQEPGESVIYALAFLVGLVLGPVLGFARWLVLRRHVRRAVLWMPANALAWAFGMVVVFAGADPAAAGGASVVTAALVLLALAAAGAVVGAVHGVALVWLLRSRGPAT